MMNANIERYHARHDRAHCLAPGIFRSLKRGQRKKQKLDTTYVYGEVSLRFVGFEPLGADDMRFLQGIIALAGPHGLILDPSRPQRQGISYGYFWTRSLRQRSRTRWLSDPACRICSNWWA
jgi:hypothetical protein